MSFAARAISAAGVASSTKYSGTITQGFYYDGSFVTQYGFGTTPTYASTFGSRSPTTISGYTFAGCSDTYFGTSSGLSSLAITGFASDPGVDFVTSVTIDGIQQFPSSYTYSAGSAYWYFSVTFGFLGSGTASCAITGL